MAFSSKDLLKDNFRKFDREALCYTEFENEAETPLILNELKCTAKQGNKVLWNHSQIQIHFQIQIAFLFVLCI
jgi:hypothetical protein